MFRSRIGLIALFLLISISALYADQKDPTLKIVGSAPSAKDAERIQRIVLRMMNGIQYQDPYKVYMSYYPDPSRSQKENEEEMQRIKSSLNALFTGLENREVAKPYEGMHSTFDFAADRKELRFSADGNEALMDLDIGFYEMPGDPSVLAELPAEKTADMSDREKEIRSKYRTARLHFQKIEGSWYVISFGDLVKALNKTFDFYTSEVANNASREKTKR